MPLYDYQCTNCGKSCELLQKVNDAPFVKCPSCGTDHLQRQVSAPHFQLKGSGWYVTDFKGTKTPEDKPSAPPPPTDSKTTKETDS